MYSKAIPSFTEIRGSFKTTEGVVLDRNGRILQEYRKDDTRRKLSWCTLDDISFTFLKTLIKSEDKNFYSHDGVDWRAIAKASIDFVFLRGKRGASTITMQLVSMLENQGKWTGKKTVLQKIDQIRLAKQMEASWRKNEILEAYINLIPFRGELVGITAASKGLFEKHPHGLNEVESAILVALIRSPNSDQLKLESRACALFRSINQTTDCLDISEKINGIFSKNYSIKNDFIFAFHASRRLSMSSNVNNGVIESTIDLDVQNRANEILKKHLTSLSSKNVKDGAVLVFENQSGNVLAYVGNSGKFSTSPEVDAVIAKRQAGSTLKPFLYALAFEKNFISPESILEDSPLDIPVYSGIYRPANYEKKYHGLVKAKVALASSLNVPAVRVLNLVGVDLFFQVLNELNFGDLKSPSFYGPSLALGSLDVSLWDLTSAYGVFANGGVLIPLRLKDEKILERRRIFSEKTSREISEILSDRDDRSMTFGLENPLSTKYQTSVKTGTSKDMRDNWCVGFSKEFTVGVWVGNFSGEPMWHVSGVTGAAPIWRELIDYLGEKQSNNKNLREVKQNHLQEKIDRSILKQIDLGKNKIIYPADGSIFAIDPDIPPDNQKLFFESEYPQKNVFWEINGVMEKNHSNEVFFWKPIRGKHLIRLIDKERGVIDSIRIEVR